MCWHLLQTYHHFVQPMLMVVYHLANANGDLLFSTQTLQNIRYPITSNNLRRPYLAITIVNPPVHLPPSSRKNPALHSVHVPLASRNNCYSFYKQRFVIIVLTFTISKCVQVEPRLTFRACGLTIRALHAFGIVAF